MAEAKATPVVPVATPVTAQGVQVVQIQQSVTPNGWKTDLCGCCEEEQPIGTKKTQ